MTIDCGLIKGRHKLPDYIKDYVFDSDIPQAHICDSAYLEEICTAFLALRYDVKTVNVYVTGFTPAMLALVRICSLRGVKLNAYNYDRESKEFWKQEVL